MKDLCDEGIISLIPYTILFNRQIDAVQKKIALSIGNFIDVKNSKRINHSGGTHDANGSTNPDKAGYKIYF